MTTNYTPSRQKIAELQNRIWACQRRSPSGETAVTSTGCGALDELLPDHGIRPGSLVEWIGAGAASGAGTLSLLVGRCFCGADSTFLIVDYKREVYPVALAALGFDLARLLVVRPNSQHDALWACEEALRSGAVDIAWANIECLSGNAFRRLQLAAEQSRAVGFLIRPAGAIRQPSWADVRLLVAPRPARGESLCLGVEVLYSRGRPARSAANVEVDCRGTLRELFCESKKDIVPLVSPLADSVPACFQVRA
jgi:protein ImuA